jgi:hypothetical protein
MPWDQDLDSNSPAYGIASSQARFNRIVAGPGTGNSFALKRRVARLLEEGADPKSILPVTFTNVAAEDLQREMLQIGVPGTTMPWKAGSGMAKGTDRGVLFCAGVGDRTFLRFVPADDSWCPKGGDDAIVGELGSCLRIVECEPETPRVVPQELENDHIFDLWTAAQARGCAAGGN